VRMLRRTEIRTGDTIGVVFEPEEGSDHFAIALSGSTGGIPEHLARRLAENGVSAFALGYWRQYPSRQCRRRRRVAAGCLLPPDIESRDRNGLSQLADGEAPRSCERQPT
jgi:hypothetical protein